MMEPGGLEKLLVDLGSVVVNPQKAKKWHTVPLFQLFHALEG